MDRWGDLKKNPQRYRPYYGVEIGDYLNHFGKAKYGKNQIHFFHNGTKFDFIFIVEWLIANNWEQLLSPYGKKRSDEVILYRKSLKHDPFYVYLNSKSKYKSLIVFIFDDVEQTWIQIQFFDTLKMFPNYSIAEMGDEVDIKKVDFDVDLQQDIVQNYDLLPSIVKERCQIDVDIMLKFLENKICDGITFPAGSEISYSASKRAYLFFISYLKNNVGVVKTSNGYFNDWLEIEADDKRKINIFCQSLKQIERVIGCQYPYTSLYKGGITSFHPDHKDSKNVTSFDVNSLYPSMMTKLLPFGKMKLSKGFKPLKNHFCFYFVKFKKLKQLIKNCVPFVDLNSNPNHQKIKYHKYDYEGSDLVMFLTQDEFDVFTNPKYFECEFEVLTTMSFKQKFVFRDYILKIYNEKVLAENESQRGSSKTKLNALYGKTGESPFRESFYNLKYSNKLKDLDCEVIDYIDNDEVGVIQTQDSESAYNPLAMAITGLARGFLMETALNLSFNNATINIVYCDTDSLKIEALNDVNWNDFFKLDPDKLGYWKKEYNVKYFKVLKQKTYAGSDDLKTFALDKKGKPIIACCGINKSDVIQQLNFTTFQPNQIIYSNTSKKIKGGVLVYKQKKKLSELDLFDEIGEL